MARSPARSKPIRNLLKSIEEVPDDDLKTKVRDAIQDYYRTGRAEEGTSAAPKAKRKARKTR